jgi:hypothetical protein
MVDRQLPSMWGWLRPSGWRRSPQRVSVNTCEDERRHTRRVSSTIRAARELPINHPTVERAGNLTTAMTAETIGQSLLIRTDDHREGRLALREGRPPQFEGC